MKLEDVTLDQVYEFMERGSANNAPKHIVDYLQMIENVRGMIDAFNIYKSKNGVVKSIQLMYGLSAYRAAQVHDEAIQYFNVNVKVSKTAWRNYYADLADKALKSAILIAKETKDFISIIKSTKDIAELRGVFDEEKEELPDNFFDKPINLLMQDGNVFEFGSANRERLEVLIDKFPEITEKERNKLKQQSGITELKIFTNEQTD